MKNLELSIILLQSYHSASQRLKKNKVIEMVPKRLGKNQKLHKNLAENMTYGLSKRNSGLLNPSMTLPINFDLVSSLFKYIVKGSANYHWGVYLKDDILIEVMSLTAAGENFFEERFFRLNCRARIIETIGENTFWYEGVQGIDCPQITAWKFSVYNGLQLGGDPEAPDELSSLIGAHSGPKDIFEKANKRLRY